MGKKKYILRTLLLTVITGAIVGFSGHQSPYPTDYFVSPLDMQLLLSGSFGELRSNHFHSGIDIKTQDREGHSVMASADGWVSRIKVSPTGYGNALYVDHPNGYTTVYAHLQRFRDDIAEYVEELQYSKRRFALDVRPEKGRFPVTQGKEIAKSGNSGGSTGPHLHFEVRRTHNSHPINPQAFGINITDSTAPRIYRLKAYPADKESYIEAYDPRTRKTRTAVFGEALVFSVRGSGSTWELADTDDINVHGSVKFSIQTHDYHEGSRSRLGATRVSLLADDELVFQSEITEFSFNQTRYLNAHIDFSERRTNRRWFHRSHLLPGNRLPFYKGSKDGILSVADGETKRMRYVIEDIKQNTSGLSFSVHGTSDRGDLPVVATDATLHVPYGETATLTRPGIRVHIPSGSLYEDVFLTYDVEDAVDGSFADVHVVHDDNTPVHSRMTVSILANRLPARLRPYALVAGVTDKGNLYSFGGEYSGGYVTSRIRSFGKYTIAADTTAPEIRSINLTDDMSSRSSIRMSAKDDLSGIQSYNGFVDGEWVLMEYDAKRNLFYHTFDGRIGPGEHTFKFVVDDGKGNRAEYERTFTR